MLTAKELEHHAKLERDYDIEMMMREQIEEALKEETRIPKERREWIAVVAAQKCALELLRMDELEEQREEQERLLRDAENSRRKLERAKDR